MNRAVAIANEFLRKKGGTSLTQMQLQKLVYISHGWTLAITDSPLTLEEPEAWDYGPVYSDLYDHTKLFGRSPIGRLITPDDDEPARFFRSAGKSSPPYQASLTEDETAIINNVWSKYGDLSGAILSALTHKSGTPWSKTYDGRRNRIISNNVIADHFCSLANRAKQNAK